MELHLLILVVLYVQQANMLHVSPDKMMQVADFFPHDLLSHFI